MLQRVIHLQYIEYMHIVCMVYIMLAILHICYITSMIYTMLYSKHATYHAI